MAPKITLLPLRQRLINRVRVHPNITLRQREAIINQLQRQDDEFLNITDSYLNNLPNDERPKLADIMNTYIRTEPTISSNAQREINNSINDLLTGRTKTITLNNNNFLNEGRTVEEWLSFVVSQIPTEQRAIISFNTNTTQRPNYTLNDTNRYNLLNFLSRITLSNETYDELLNMGSDAEFVANLLLFDEITITLLEQWEEEIAPKYAFGEGEFFKYINLTPLDLSKLQIYTKAQFNSIEHLQVEECLLFALKQGGLSEEKQDKFKTIIKNMNIPKTKLKEICNFLQIRINLYCDKNARDTPIIYGKEYNDDRYNIGLLDGHYFIREMFDVQELFEYIGGKPNKFMGNRIASNKLIKLLLENKDICLTPITIEQTKILKTQYYKKIKIREINKLSFNEKYDAKEVEYKPLESDERVNIFCDFETHTTPTSEQHGYYLFCFYSECGKYVGHTARSKNNKNAFLEFLDVCIGKYNLKKIRLIFHNLSYDFNFIQPVLKRNTNILKKGNRILTANFEYIHSQSRKFESLRGKSIDVQLKDSLQVIPMRLSEFGETFKLPIKKEVMPYELYNTFEYIDMETKVPLNLFLDYAKDDDEKKQMMENIKEWELLDRKGEVNIFMYSKKYCIMDCKVLREGYIKMRQWMNEATGINIDDVITLPQLVDKYLTKEGCYDGCYNFNGVIQNFLQKFIVGGRCMVSENKKSKINNTRIADFDAVSLYPSAMFLGKGFLKGIPTIFKNKINNECLTDYDGYFVEIRVLTVGKKLKFPLASVIDDKGIRQFTNELEGKILYVDKIALEELIEHQQITFEIIKGVYFNSGFNTTINKIIEHLFNKRIELKKEKNPAQMVYKLLMNSAYGKTIMKAVETETIIRTRKQAITYIKRNYNHILDFYDIGKNLIGITTQSAINCHYNRCHIGCNILSMSKRIMNNVMCLAEDNDIEMFYQDTDSIHLKEEDINKLEKLFNEKYNVKLIGEGFGQFHSDFNASVKDENGNIINKFDSIISTDSIFLGKKSYIDVLECVKDGKKYTDYHIRMKGISNRSINYYCEENNITPFELYEKLFNGEAMSFDLTCNNKAPCFKQNKNFTIISQQSFERKVKF